MKKFLSFAMVAAVLCGAGMSQAQAAEPKPIAAMTLASYDDLKDDINYFGNLAGRPQIASALEGFLALATQGKGLAGIDKSRPWAAIVQASNEDDVAGIVFVPISNFKDALSLLELFNTVDEEGDLYKLTPKDGNKTVYVKQHGNWACFSDKSESLAHIIADPLAVLHGLDKNYIVGAKLMLANVPESLRDKFLGEFKKNLEKEAADKKDDESDAEFAQRKKLLGQVETYLVRVAGDLDQISFGWGLDRGEDKTYLDLNVTAKPDTKTADEMAVASEAKTTFSGFLSPDEAASVTIASPIPEVKQEIAASLIDVIRGKALDGIEKKAPEDQRATQKSIATDGFKLLSKVVKSGRFDFVSSTTVSPNSFWGRSALFVADGPLFDKMLHTIYKAIEDEHSEVSQFVKLDAETVNGCSIHKISVPIPDSMKNHDAWVKCLGENFDFVIGVDKENVYVAAGRDAESKLKQGIEASSGKSESVKPLTIAYALKPIMALVAVAGDKAHDRAVAAAAETELKKSPGKDHVTLTGKPIANGAQVRFEVEKGVLEAIGKIAVMTTEGKFKDDDE